MRRKTFLQLLPSALGYMVMGNLLAAIMTFSMAIFIAHQLAVVLAAIFAIAIYIMLISVPAYKNGTEERMLLANKRVESVPMKRWLYIGMIIFAVTIIPTILFLTRVIDTGLFRLTSGAVYPLSLLISPVTEEGIRPMFSFTPYITGSFYLVSIPTCYLAFKFGLNDTFNADKIMYKK